MRFSTNISGYNFILMTAIISGFAIFTSGLLVKGINPSVFTTTKNLFAVFLLAVLLISAKELRTFVTLPWKHLRKLILVGIVGGSIPFLLFFYGLSITSATEAAFIHKIMFIFVAVMAFFLLKERLSRKQAVATIGLLVGVFLLVGAPTTVDLGAVLIFIATLFWASETIISKHILKELSPNLVAFGRMFFGSLILLMFLAVTGEISTMASLSLEQVAMISLTALFLFGYVFTWYHGLQLIKASEAAAILVLGSVITTLLSYMMGMAITLEQTAGVILIVSSIALMIGTGFVSKKVVSKITGVYGVKS